MKYLLLILLIAFSANLFFPQNFNNIMCQENNSGTSGFNVENYPADINYPSVVIHRMFYGFAYIGIMSPVGYLHGSGFNTGWTLGVEGMLKWNFPVQLDMNAAYSSNSANNTLSGVWLLAGPRMEVPFFRSSYFYSTINLGIFQLSYNENAHTEFAYSAGVGIKLRELTIGAKYAASSGIPEPYQFISLLAGYNF